MKNTFKSSKGITLVALVITIIILLILAGISISALTNTGIFGKAKDAKQKSDEAALDQNTKLDEYESEINAYLPGQNNGGGGQGSGINANTIASATDTEKANNYYGKSVNYTSANGVTGWKIFYAGKITDATDETNNIYLIADDYVDVAKLPKGTNEAGQSVGKAPANTSTGYPKAAPFINIMDAYSTGAARITTDTIKKLNSSFFARSDSSSNTNPNMKAVAYMLDTTAWSTFKDNNGNNGKADYAIGGPTLEMLFKSYNQKHPGKNYEAQATKAEGYQLRVNGGSWTTNSSDYLDSNDSLYVISSKTNAEAMWVASPSARGTNIVMNVNYFGIVDYYGFVSNNDSSSNISGFRPLVCLKSNVQLQESGDGFSIK